MNNTQPKATTITITNSIDSFLIDPSDVEQCYFVEDIYSFLKVGKLIFRDSRGIVEFLPLLGGERIDIIYGSYMEDTHEYQTKEFSFIIHRISDIAAGGNDKQKTIELFFIEKQHYMLHTNNFSLSFYKKKYSDIVNHICKNHLGIEEFCCFDDSNETLEYFYTGLKTPSTNIKWLSNRCSGVKSGQPGYLLYSNTKNTENSFNFTTLEGLLQNTELMEPDKGSYVFNSDNTVYINKILTHSISKIDYNVLSSMSGMIHLGYDILRKKLLRQEYDYIEALKRFTVLGSYSLFDSDRMVITAPNERTTGENDETVMDNLYYSNWIKQYCIQQTVSITVVGHVERYAGGMIEIEWPSGDKDSISDKNMMGKYLVKSITHQFVPSATSPYIQKMVLIKNGYQNSDYHPLTKTTKSNL